MTPSADSEPRVTIAIPAYNRKGMLVETLESVRAQTYPHWEANVVDDGSSDGTLDEIPPRFADEPRIRFFAREGERGNANVCRNQGRAKGSGGYVVFLDSDDLLAPDCLERRVRDMDAHPELDYIAYMAELFVERPGDLGLLWNVFTTEPDLTRFLRIDGPWQTTGPIWRRGVLERHPWDETVLSWQDGDFHRRVLAAGVRGGRVARVDHYIRRAPHSKDNISLDAGTIEHLVCHARCFADTARVLAENSLLTPYHAHLMAAATFGKCRDLVALNRPGLARAAWRDIAAAGCAGRMRGAEGGLAFALCRIAPLRRAALAWLGARWADYNLIATTTTVHKALAPSDEVTEAPVKGRSDAC